MPDAHSDPGSIFDQLMAIEATPPGLAHRVVDMAAFVAGHLWEDGQDHHEFVARSIVAALNLLWVRQYVARHGSGPSAN